MTNLLIKHVGSNPYGVVVGAGTNLAEPLMRLKLQLSSAY